MGKTYITTSAVEPEIQEQLRRLTSKEKIFVAELAGLSESFIYRCIFAKKCSQTSYKKIKDALNVFLSGDYSSELSKEEVSAAAFKLDLKFACKSTAVSSRIEAEYYVNPDLAALMLREAETIEDCNAILDRHFQCSGIAGNSSLTRLENEY